MKRVWRLLLKEWRRESRSKGTLPKQHFPLLLNRLAEATKKQNIVSGLRAAGLYPVNQVEVLKHIMQVTNATLDESTLQLFGPSIVRVLLKNLGDWYWTNRKKEKFSKKKNNARQTYWNNRWEKNEEPSPSGNEGPGPSGSNPPIAVNRDLAEDVLPVYK